MISVHLTFSVNYFFIFEREDHSSEMKIAFCFIFALVHIVLISIYMLHQSSCCGPFYSKYEEKHGSALRFIQEDFDQCGIQDILLPQ
mmetsp:Transcript_20618/g.20349  ORF Transcript_20618/g.20349 Transcript_20618/m.20349 type:complete len:87 (-) Transcript_20618:29-289(-)